MNRITPNQLDHRPSKFWKYAFGGLAAVAGAVGAHVAGAEARPPAPDPMVIEETETPACLPETKPTTDNTPVRPTPVHRRVRDRLLPIPV